MRRVARGHGRAGHRIAEATRGIRGLLEFLVCGEGRGPLVLCWVICGAWWIAALHLTANAQPLGPDAAHAAGLARNLVRGLGYTIEWVPFHLGFHDSIRHVPEWHGFLRPVALAVLFWLFGIDDGLVRVPGFTYTALTGVVAFAFARRLFGAGAGLLACLLTLSSRALYFWSWAGTDDTGFVLFFMCTIYSSYLALAGADRYIALAGLAGALALLEKQTALYLPWVFFLVLILGRPRGAGPRRAVWLFGPLVLALAVYLARNQAAYGGFMFRLGILNWLLKIEGIPAVYSLLDQPPRLLDVLASIGAAKILSIQFEQLKAMLAAVFLPLGPPRGGLNLLAIGIPSLAFHVRRDPLFAWLGAWSILGGVLFICGLYTMESRYFLMFVPLVSVSLAGVVSRVWRGIGSGWIRAGLRATAAVAAIAILFNAAKVNWSVDDLARADNRSRCSATVAWVRRQLPPGEPLLTLNPWWVSWATDRPAVMIPTGGREEVARVAEHYGTVFEFDLPMGNIVAESPARDLRGASVFGAGRCTIYRLRIPGK